MKFRSLLYLGIAGISLFFQVVLAQRYGGIGCAWAIAIALLVGQGVIMNLYYHYKQGLDMVVFWKEIAKMSRVPIVICMFSFFLLKYISLESWLSLGLAIVIFVAIYVPLFSRYGMNGYERNLFMMPIRKMKDAFVR